MDELCTGCGKGRHAGGCHRPFSVPPAPSPLEVKRRQDYLLSPEFAHICAASLAGRNPATFPKARKRKKL